MIKIFLKKLFIASITLMLATSTYARQTTMLPGVVKNFELPTFDENTGVKEWEVFGAEAQYVSDNRIDVNTVKLDIYEGKQEASLRATIRTPFAQVNPTNKISKGDSDISVDAPEFEMTGKGWLWKGEERFIEVFNDVEITTKPQSQKDEITTINSTYASFSYLKTENIFKLEKNIIVKNPQMTLECDKMDASASKKTSGLDDILATGNVKMTSDNKYATADILSVDPQKGYAKLNGNPKILDMSSNAQLLGSEMIINKAESKIISKSDKNKRAMAIIFNKDKDDKEQKIEIIANNISMFTKDNKNQFKFVGNVLINAEDFNASCDELEAITFNKSSNANEKIETILGNGNIRFENKDGIATGDSMKITPEKSEIWLVGNAQLKNDLKGMKLNSDIIGFIKDENRGVALCNDKNAFVILELSNIKDFTGNDKDTQKTQTTIVKSRILQFKQNEKSLEFVFNQDVSITSSDMTATCEVMNVYAQSDSQNTSTLKKIVASDNVIVRQKGYLAEAEIATIYPKLAEETDENKVHKYIELSTSPANPIKRPKITLPSFDGIGIKDMQSNASVEKLPTIIVSDKQWLTSSKNVDNYYFKGNVKATGTDMLATCDNAEVVLKPQPIDNEKQITQIIMKENIKLEQDLREIHCGRADIFVLDQILQLTKDPIVINREDNSRVTGSKIIYNRGKESILVEGNDNAHIQEPKKSNNFQVPVLPSQESSTQRPTMKLPVNFNKK